MSEYKVNVRMTEADFERLVDTSMRWRGTGWHQQAERFEVEDDPAAEPGWDWEMAYWTGEQFINALLVREYLRAQDQPCEILFDTSAEFAGYIVLTNYVTASRQRAAAVLPQP